jgi:hypothetical protein
MSNSRLSLGRRVLATSLTWLLLGCVIGVIEGLGQGGGIQILAMMVGGMTVLPVVGVLLGLIGGDAIGSVTGAAGGLLGCLAGDLVSGLSIQPHVLSVLVVFSGLLGATGFLFLRFLIWKYRMMFRTFCWLTGFTPGPGSALGIAAEFLGLYNPAIFPASCETLPTGHPGTTSI